MPTGYTANIKDGITFKQFAMQCARAFGALITMRDDPFDTPIPEELKPDTSYHDRGVKTAQAEVRKFKKMTHADMIRGAAAATKKEVAYWRKARKENIDLKNKYQAMLDKVQAWVPPTAEHQGIKDFMIQQLTDSMKWDCHYADKEKPKPFTGKEWHADRLKGALRDVQYHKDERQKEIERTAQRNKWLKAYREAILSLPD